MTTFYYGNQALNMNVISYHLFCVQTKETTSFIEEKNEKYNKLPCYYILPQFDKMQTFYFVMYTTHQN